MIELPLTTALAVYSGIVLLGAAAVWLYTEAASHRAYRKVEKQHLWRCTYCGYVYLDEEAGAYSNCPRCDSINRLDDSGARYVRPTREERTSLKTELRDPDDRHGGSKQKRPGRRRRGGRRRR